MSVRERDPLTGHETTGHEWNGIAELNTRVPRAVWFFIIVIHIYALIAWILLPTWPLIVTYTGGVLGIDQRRDVADDIATAEAARAVWRDRIAAGTLEEIRADPALMAAVDATGPALYGNNCLVCHGQGGRGGPGFPDLSDGDWLWGGDDEAVMETIRVGINSSHPETRFSQMLAFGRDGMLTRDEIRSVAAYVGSLSTGTPATGPGARIFADNCASCHGEDGTGMVELGAPDLTDGAWIYGGDPASLFTTIHDGRAGVMPAWEGRLSEVDRKILALYVHGLGQAGAQ